MKTLADYYRTKSPDLPDKCHQFGALLDQLRAEGLYQPLYRLELQGPLDHTIRVRDPRSGQERALICFDSNSYLGLHLHPRVLSATRRALDEAGYGTPSAQLLGGTNRWLRELEETVATFHGRASALIFPSGYAANVGILTGLLRSGDLFLADRLAHASLHDGCRWSGAHGGTYAHRDPADLARQLSRAEKVRGRLVVTDGVFSMHGRLAQLRDLRRVTAAHGAYLLVDEAHSVGVLGETGRGLEEHFGMPGAIDILMGTFSKAPGSVGGYVCGDRELIDYLRFYARSCVFTAALPSATCAGITEAFRVMAEEPEHRERLWRAARRLWAGLRQVGFTLEPLESPILTIPVGDLALLLQVGRELFDGGLKVGTVGFPAVPRREGLLRLSVNARHRDEEIDRSIEVLARVAARHGLLGVTQAELRAEAAGGAP